MPPSRGNEWERYFDETEKWYFWFNSTTYESRWELEEGVLPERAGSNEMQVTSPSKPKRCSKTYMMQLLRADGNALQHSPEFQTDKEAVMIAVKSNGLALQHGKSTILTHT